MGVGKLAVTYIVNSDYVVQYKRSFLLQFGNIVKYNRKC